MVIHLEEAWCECVCVEQLSNKKNGCTTQVIISLSSKQPEETFSATFKVFLELLLLSWSPSYSHLPIYTQDYSSHTHIFQ